MTHTGMPHVGCPRCRLRFSPATAANLLACPRCGGPPQLIDGAQGLIGFRLFSPDGPPHDVPEASAVSLPVPDPDQTGS